MKSEHNFKDDIYNAIIEGILSQEYRANQILNEKDLVEKYGRSKTPVREALVALCNDNVLRSIPRYGYEVVRLTGEDIQEMLQFRLILESGLLKLNYDKFGQTQIDRLRSLDEKCNATKDDIWKHWAHNTEFHLKMISYCNNSYAIEELQKCMDRLKRAYAQFYWDKWDQASKPVDTRNHAMIIQSLLDKDIDGILYYLKDDLNDFRINPQPIKVSY